MMMTRRDFIAAGATAPTAAGTVQAKPLASDLQRLRAQPSIMVFDERFADTRLFAQQAALNSNFSGEQQ
jgi:hypothetical protein